MMWTYDEVMYIMYFSLYRKTFGAQKYTIEILKTDQKCHFFFNYNCISFKNSEQNDVQRQLQ